jgi:hypothetical protein
MISRPVIIGTLLEIARFDHSPDRTGNFHPLTPMNAKTLYSAAYIVAMLAILVAVSILTNMKILYVVLYVSFLLGILVYALVELFQVEAEAARGEPPPAGPRPRAPGWYYYAGIVAIGVGVLACGISVTIACIVNSGDKDVAIYGVVTGALNPFFFIGVPLGIAWLRRSKGPAASR